ncbi:MAG: transcription antitermination factor NusB [Treponema sp.]|nr:transcription antitermination factor NusB [Treponema sp.]
MSRRIGRILAFQALYSWDVGGVEIDDLLSFEWLVRDSSEHADEEVQEEGDEVQYSLIEKQIELFDGLTPEKKNEVFTFARLLVKGTMEHLDEIDEIIKAHLSAKWSIERINKVALAVLRMSIYSLLYQKDVHPSIVIDEAVEIVKEYGADDAHKFTNALLDTVAKDISKES